MTGYSTSMRIRLPAVCVVLEVILIILFGVLVKYDHETDAKGWHKYIKNHNNKSQVENDFYYRYASFQDVHVMIFIGFGFLMTFLKRYGYGSVGFNFLIASFSLQWATLMQGFFHGMKEDGKIHIGVESFNSAITAHGDDQHRTAMNTYYSLASCTLATFAMSALVNHEGKLDMVHIQNAALAGGVAMGTAGEMMLTPFGSMIVGFLAGTISTLGYKYLTPILNSKLKVQDTCGIHNLHGMPGILGAIVGAVTAATATADIYGDGLAVGSSLLEWYSNPTILKAGIVRDESRLFLSDQVGRSRPRSISEDRRDT
ncbi:UNVERIFIED_CONTAM: hypothetical protein FKN15_024304 [Acipenser sinensis]